MENIIENIKDGAHKGNDTSKSGFTLARYIADKKEEETGNKHIVRRVIDYIDRYEGRDREHYSFDVVEITNE